MVTTRRESSGGRRSNGHVDRGRLNIHGMRLLGRDANLDGGAVGKEDGKVDAADVVSCRKNGEGGETGEELVQGHFE